MDSEGRLQFAKLSSVNYRSWSFTIRAVLASKDLAQYIDKKVEDLVDAKARELSAVTPSPAPSTQGGTTPSASKAADVTTAAIAKATKELELQDSKAQALIVVHIGVDQLSFIATATTAYQQWSLLKAIYEPTGPAQLAALLAAFHSYSLRPSVPVDKVASDLTTIQADIRLIEPTEAPTDKAKLVTLTELLIRSNDRYEGTVLMIRNVKDMAYGQAVVMLKQAEERIQSGGSPHTETAYQARDRALMASNKPFRPAMPKIISSQRGRGGFGRHAGDSRPRGKPTGGSRECWHCGSQNHIRTACPTWLNTPEGTKWAAKNPSKHHRAGPEGAWLAEDTAIINRQVWLVDSGATSHMTWNRDLFTTLLEIEPPTLVTIANGTSIPCRGVGSIELRQDIPLVPDVITIQNVRYMPDLNTNLLSVSKLEDRGISVASRPGFLDLIRYGKTIATAQRSGGSYVLELGSGNHQEAAFAAKDGAAKDGSAKDNKANDNKAGANKLTWDIIHARLAHVGDHFIANLPDVTEGFIQVEMQPKHLRKACDPCVRSKQIRVISRDPPLPAKEPLGRLYIDGWGPYPVLAFGYNNAQYFFTMTCEATRKKWVIICLKRSHFPAEFMGLKAYIELQSGYKLMAVRLDNAGENKTLGKELSRLGIAVEYTTAYTPSQNGVAERLNRTLVGMAKAMLLASGLPQKFWGFAIETACYIRNRLPVSPGQMTPEEAFTGKKPNICHLRVFGCLAYVLKPQELRLKLDPNSYKTAFVGYEESTCQYRLYDPVRNLIVRSHNVEWYENEHLDVNWNEQIDGYLTVQTDDGDDSGSDSGAGTISLIPLDDSRTPEEGTDGMVRALFPPPSMVPRGNLQPETDQPDMPDEPETESISVP
jgi:hypothetical protein